MLITIIGENCTGKSTLADKINEELKGTIYSGKDYIRMAKNENVAKRMFRNELESAVNNDCNIIYVIAENDLLELVPNGGKRIVVTADLEVIKERFSKRMNGHLPLPVAKMLEAKHGSFDNLTCDARVDLSEDSLESVVKRLLNE